MPVPMLKNLSAETGVDMADLERYWADAKEQANADKTGKWGLVTSIVQRRAHNKVKQKEAPVKEAITQVEEGKLTGFKKYTAKVTVCHKDEVSDGDGGLGVNTKGELGNGGPEIDKFANYKKPVNEKADAFDERWRNHEKDDKATVSNRIQTSKKDRDENMAEILGQKDTLYKTCGMEDPFDMEDKAQHTGFLTPNRKVLPNDAYVASRAAYTPFKPDFLDKKTKEENERAKEWEAPRKKYTGIYGETPKN